MAGGHGTLASYAADHLQHGADDRQGAGKGRRLSVLHQIMAEGEENEGGTHGHDRRGVQPHATPAGVVGGVDPLMMRTPAETPAGPNDVAVALFDDGDGGGGGGVGVSSRVGVVGGVMARHSVSGGSESDDSFHSVRSDGFDDADTEGDEGLMLFDDSMTNGGTPLSSLSSPGFPGLPVSSVGDGFAEQVGHTAEDYPAAHGVTAAAAATAAPPQQQQQQQQQPQPPLEEQSQEQRRPRRMLQVEVEHFSDVEVDSDGEFVRVSSDSGRDSDSGSGGSGSLSHGSESEASTGYFRLSDVRRLPAAKFPTCWAPRLCLSLDVYVATLAALCRCVCMCVYVCMCVCVYVCVCVCVRMCVLARV